MPLIVTRPITEPCIIAAPYQGALNVHVEQNVECTSHFLIPFLIFGCKTTVFWVIHRYAKCSSLRNKKQAAKER